MRKTFREELYISVDIEASGPIPGLFSMLSTGACVVGDVNKGFYIELKPLNDNLDAEAMQFTGGLSLETLKRNGADPKTAMAQFEQWIREVSGNKRPRLRCIRSVIRLDVCSLVFHHILGAKSLRT
jgi:hypothetical protein